MIEVVQVMNRNAHKEVLKIREEVFVIEQGISKEIEADKNDSKAVHVLAYENRQPVGCGRIVFENNQGKIGRVAVLKSKRGRGIGRSICSKLIDIAVVRGVSKVILHAQLHTAEFYKSIGFEPVGLVFQEAGIDHIKMVINSSINMGAKKS